MDFFASVRRPATLTMSEHNSSLCNGVTSEEAPTTPMSCDGVTLLSLPSFRSVHHSVMSGNSAGNSRRRRDDLMSTSLLDRNESWSSFSSLHSLPEPFLHQNHGDVASRGIPDNGRGITAINGWREDVRGDGIRKPVPLLVNGYASEDTQMSHTRNVFGRPSRGLESYSSSRSNDSGTLHASSVGRDVEANGFGYEDQLTLQRTQTPGLPARYKQSDTTYRSSSSRTANAVLGQLKRAKSVTSKTLRKFGPKFSESAKSVGSTDPSSSDVKSSIVRRSSTIAQRFRAFRQPSVDSPSGLGVGGGKGGPLSLRRERERSPLANDTPSGHAANPSDSFVEPKFHATTSARDPLRRVLFGATASKGGRKNPESAKKRQSFHGRDRATSCGDEVPSGSDVLPASRPRSTEPPSRSVVIKPALFHANASSPIMIETCRSAVGRNSPLALESSYGNSQFPPARSPRMASPESSSLSSGSPASVFSAMPPSGSYRPGTRDGYPSLSSPALDSAPSMSDLSLWEMPKLDIDLIDQIFVRPDDRSRCQGTVQNSVPTSEPVLAVKPPNCVITDNDSLSVLGTQQQATNNGCGDFRVRSSEPPKSAACPKQAGGIKSESRLSAADCESTRPDCGTPGSADALVIKDLKCLSDSSHVDTTTTSHSRSDGT